jgi:hypothetical protein
MTQNNASDSNQVKRAKRDSKREEKNLEVSIRAIMSDPRGRCFIKWILNQCGYDFPSYEPGLKIEEVAYREGKKFVGNALVSSIDPILYTKMMEESKLPLAEDEPETESEIINDVEKN